MESIRILHLEDNNHDAELIAYHLQKQSLDCHITHVGTKEEFLQALKSGQFDIIISDYSLPKCNGLEALKIAREKYPDIPFVFYSRSLELNTPSRPSNMVQQITS